eukprot:scaffold348074_cov30-Prasinocladus_malaysianus.AAC.1
MTSTRPQRLAALSVSARRHGPTCRKASVAFPNPEIVLVLVLVAPSPPGARGQPPEADADAVATRKRVGS